MLVITRKKDEELIIGENIRIKIISVENGSAKIAIEAPKEVVILRKELYDEVLNENLNATKNNINIMEQLKKLKKQ